MQLYCLQENLSRGLSVVQRAVATRTTLPITQNVFMATDNSRLKLAATNLEIAISTLGGSERRGRGIDYDPRPSVDGVRQLAARGAHRHHIIGSASQPSADLREISREHQWAGRRRLPTDTNSGRGHNRSDRRLRAPRRHQPASHLAAATEDSRPVLTGIKVEITGDSFTFAAADGFRLAIYEGKLAEPVSEDISFILPARALQEVNRLIGGQTGSVEFTVTPQKSQALFRMDNVELVSQLVQGTFPDYKQLIPESYDSRVVVSQDAFLRATRTASIFARDGSGIVRLHMSSGTDDESGRVAVESRAEELGDNTGEIDAEVQGGDAKIAFNSKYLSDVLEVLGDGEVALETTTPSSPGVIKPASDSESHTYTHVVMPMFVQW